MARERPNLLVTRTFSKAHGLCAVDPGSMNSTATVAVVKAARLLETPWFLFADGDEPGVAAVDSLLRQIAEAAEHPQIRADRIVQLPTGSAIEALLASFDLELCKAALAAVRPLDTPVPDTQVQSALEKVKGSAGRSRADALIRRYPDVGHWPQPFQDLVRIVEVGLTPSPSPTTLVI